ncbi:MAG: response regulator transcription factor [Blautia sp.]|nr:response regulator transcription factor [Blautia sp.]
MNIAIVDDERTDRICLERRLREYDRIHQLDMVLHHYSSGEALLKEYQPFSYAVVFLDIFMDGMSGIETAKTIRESDDEVILIFMTVSETHRPDAFSVFARDYLIKPVSDEQVFRIMDHLLKIRTGDGPRFSFSYDRTNYSLRCEDIVALEKNGNYMNIIDRNHTAYKTRMTFAEARTKVDGRFLVLMKGLMVNMAFIRQIRDGQCLMHNGDVFPLSVKKTEELLQKWLNYKFTSICNSLTGREDNI